MDGFTRRKEHSKEDIRKAAFELFSQFGVDRVSIVDIARKAGVSQATIYNNFDSKEALAREFVAASVEQLVSQVEKVLATREQYQEKMSAFIQLITQMTTTRQPSSAERAFFTSSLDLLYDPEFERIREAAQERMGSLLLSLVHQGKQQGQVKPDLSEESIKLYFAAFMDLFANPVLQDRFYQHPELVRELGSMMVAGLREGN